MAYRYREDIVGKRFLCVPADQVKNSIQWDSNRSGQQTKTLDRPRNPVRADECEREPGLWHWRSGVIRAATHRNNTHPELQLLLEYDDADWEDRDWVNVHESRHFRAFLVEHSLVWAERRPLRQQQATPPSPSKSWWPALAFCTLVNHTDLSLGLETGPIDASGAPTAAGAAADDTDAVAIATDTGKTNKSTGRLLPFSGLVPLEFLDDKQRDFVCRSSVRPFVEWEQFGLPVGADDDYGVSSVNECARSAEKCSQLKEFIQRWAESQAGQRILVTTPSIVVGYRVQVYRAEGTTQWYTAVIVAHDEASGELALIDDTVLEEHYEDPRLLQIRLIGDGVVGSILRGDTIGIAPRRSRTTTQTVKLGSNAIQLKRSPNKRAQEKQRKASRKLEAKCKVKSYPESDRGDKTTQPAADISTPAEKLAPAVSSTKGPTELSLTPPKAPTGLAGGSSSGGLLIIPLRSDKPPPTATQHEPKVEEMERDRSNDLTGVELRQNKKSPPLESGIKAGVKKPEAVYHGAPPPLYMQQYGLSSASFPHYASHQAAAAAAAAAAAEMLWKNTLTQFGSPYHAAAHPPAKEELRAAVQEREWQDRSSRERRDMDLKEHERLEKERQEQAVHLHFEESLRLAQQKLGATNYKQPAATTNPPPPRSSSNSAAEERERERYMAAVDRERHHHHHQQQQQLRTTGATPPTSRSSSSNPFSALPRADLNFSAMSYQGNRSKPEDVKSGVIVGPSHVTFKPYERQPVVSRSSRTPPTSGYPIHHAGHGPGSGQHSPSPSRSLQQPGYNMPPPSVSPSRSPGHLGPPLGYPSMYSAALAPVQSPSPLQGGSKGKAGSASPAPGHLAAPPVTVAATSFGRPLSLPSVSAGITTGVPLRRPSPEQAHQTAPLSLTTSGKVPSSTQGSPPILQQDHEVKPNSAFMPHNPSRQAYVQQQQQPLDLGCREEAPVPLGSSAKSSEVPVKTKTEMPAAFLGLGSQPMMSVAALIDAANAAAAAAAQGSGSDPASFVLGLKSSSPMAASPSSVKSEPSPSSVTPAADVKPVKAEPVELSQQQQPIAPPPAPSSAKPVHKLKTAWLQRHAGGDETPVKLSNIPERDSSSPSPPKIARKIAAVSSINGDVHIETSAVHYGEAVPAAAAAGGGPIRGRRKRGGGATTLGRRIGTKPRTSAAAAVAAVVAAASSSASGSDSGSDEEEESSSLSKARRSNRELKPSAGKGPGRQRSSDSGSSSKDSAPLKRGRGAAGSKNISTSNPFNKPSIAQLKKTGESFLQDGACWEVAPRLGKCRECRLTPHQRKRTEQHNANIFCRFYAFRRLRYTKSGQLAIAGFSHPVKDAGEDDKRLWLPQSDASPVDLDIDMSAFLVTHVGDQFCLMVQQERESMSQALSVKNDDGEPLFEEIAWKRVVQGVREMCDVCETTLFNFHWACSKCGYVVCIDCYKSRCAAAAAGAQANGITGGRDDEREQEKDKERDTYGWLYCTSRSGHDPIKLMPTQIIAGQALETMAHLIHVVRHQWGITQFCDCPQAKQLRQSSGPVNGTGISSGSNGLHKDKLLSGDSIKGKPHNGFSEPSAKFPEASDSPLNWLADVALTKDKSPSKQPTRNGGKDLFNGCDIDSDFNSDDEVGGSNFSTLRELLIRPSGPGSKESSPAPPAAKKQRLNRLETLEDVISCVIERGVNRADASGELAPAAGESARETMPVELKYFKRPDVFRTVRTREPLPVRIMVISESAALYPDVPHSWLCNGRLLRLHEPQNPHNYKIFQDQWKRGQPVLISGVHPLLDKNIWHPDAFCRDFGDDRNDLVNCMTGNLVPNQPMKKFWEGFERLTRRLKDEKGQPMLLKLKDWPPGDDFAEVLPTRFADLMKCLPVGEYTKRNGRLNLAGRLPDCFVRPDLGPKMYNAYGAPQFADKGTTNLHLDVSDAANVMVYVGIPKELNAEECIKEALKAIDDGGCDPLTRQRVRESGELPGALWHIYQARDADRIRDFLNKVALERGVRLEPHHDPIHDQSCYLDGPLRARLYQEYGVSGYAIVQCLGDVVFIPAGAPHQVRNLHSCIKVAEDFVSPENVAHCFQLTQEFRVLSDTHTNHEDKLQIKNVIYHAIKDSLSVLTSSGKHQTSNPPSADVN